MSIRAYDPDKDLAGIQRMWKEIGWADSAEDQAAMEWFVQDADVVVGTINDEPESLAAVHDGTIRYLDTDLTLAVVSAVTTSLVGRKQGFATATTARVLANAIDRGIQVAALGMFEQGFYDRLGFGTSAYQQVLTFDPSSLQVDTEYRTPSRLSADDWEVMHASLSRRKRTHGGVSFTAPSFLRAEAATDQKGFGWGYYENDRLTHFLWARSDGYSGPLRVHLMAYETSHQLLELLGLLREVGDQFRSVTLVEPPEIQLHDLLRYPVRQRVQTAKSIHESKLQTVAWWQLRILDLNAVVAQRSWTGDEIAFSLHLSDPLADHIDGPALSGLYRVTVGEASFVEPGSDPTLPTLTASIGAFSRMWFGVRPASSLAVTDHLEGPPELLAQLDEAFRLPLPHPGIDF